MRTENEEKKARSNQKFPIETMRHSNAHLMAAAIQALWPNAKFGVGPDIKNGFYYDVQIDGHSLKAEDLKNIADKMEELKAKKLTIKRFELPIDEAIKKMEELNQPFKVELLKLLKEKGSTAIIEKEFEDDKGIVDVNPQGVATVSFYQLGDFVDLCRGPHVDSTDQIGVFELYNITSAYWRGNAKNPALTRLYGYSYPTKKELKAEKDRIEEAKKRDHRNLGEKRLELFAFSEDIGPGLPMWLPNGYAIRAELERLVTEKEREYGYKTVKTPPIAKEALYFKSGHLPYYQNDMYKPMDFDGEMYRLRPMNCPHHHQVFLSKPRTYKDLPLAIAEYGLVHRYEDRGTLHGLLRVRGFTQNDAHIYCTYEQAKAEFLKVMRLHVEQYAVFDIKDYYMRLSLPDMNKKDKYVDLPEKWQKTLSIIKEAMEESGYPYKAVEGEAAFYGPKIDFIIKSAIGTEYAISTNQLDFLAADKFELKYQGNDDQYHGDIYVIHRAPLGSHERFVAFLLEHYAGAFPTWLAPEQIRITPIKESHNAYAKELEKYFFAAKVDTATGGLRVNVDSSGDTINKKIRNAQLDKIPYMVVVGDEEIKNRTISVRLRSGSEIKNIRWEDLLQRLKYEIENRKDITEEMSVDNTSVPKLNALANQSGITFFRNKNKLLKFQGVLPNGLKITFKYLDMEKNPNYQFYAGMEKQQVVEKLLAFTDKDTLGIKSLVAPEIKAAFLAGILPSSMRNTPSYQEMVNQSDKLKPKLFKKLLNAYCQKPEIYTQFVKDYLGNEGWLTCTNELGSAVSSSIHAIAKINNLEIYIWHKEDDLSTTINLQNHLTCHNGKPNEVIHLLYDNNINKYRFLNDVGGITKFNQQVITGKSNITEQARLRK